MLISICSCTGGLLPQSGGKHHVKATTFQLLFAASTGYAFLPHGKCTTDLWDIKPPVLRAEEKVILTTSPCPVQSVGAQDTPLQTPGSRRAAAQSGPKTKQSLFAPRVLNTHGSPADSEAAQGPNAFETNTRGLSKLSRWWLVVKFQTRMFPCLRARENLK